VSDEEIEVFKQQVNNVIATLRAELDAARKELAAARECIELAEQQRDAIKKERDDAEDVALADGMYWMERDDRLGAIRDRRLARHPAPQEKP